MFTKTCTTKTTPHLLNVSEKAKERTIAQLSVLICFSLMSLIGCGDQHANQHKDITTMKKRIINPWTWQDKYGFVQANEITHARRTLFTAGIVSVDGEGNLLHEGDMEKQIDQIMDNLESILEQANFKLSDVVRFTYYTNAVFFVVSALF